MRRKAMSRGTRIVRRSPGSLVRGAGRIVRAGLFLVLALVALTLSVPSTAQAIDLDFSCTVTGDDSYSRDSPGANGESIMPAVNQWEDKEQRAKNLNDTTGMVTGAVRMAEGPERYTFYELNGMRGLNWSMVFMKQGNASDANPKEGSADGDCSVMDMISNGVANMVFNGTKILSRSAISIKELASNPSPLSGLYEGRNNAVTALRDNLFIPAVAVMILLTGLWVFTKWRAQQMREVWSGVGWACLTTIAVVTLLAGKGENTNYHKLIDGADTGIGNFNSLLAEAVLSGMPGEMQPPCDLPTDDKVHNRGLRVSSCAMYDTLVFRPWALGQFGENGTNCIFKKDGGTVDKGTCKPDSPGTTCDYGRGARCEDLRVKHAESQSTTNFDRYPPDRDVSEGPAPDVDKKTKEWGEIRVDIAGGEGKGYPDEDDYAGDQAIYPVSFNDWTGRNSGTRVGLAFYSLVAALIVGIMVIVLSALTLLWHAVTLILIIMLPLVATLGIHPTQQKLLKGWLQTFIHSFVLRAGFGIILTVLLVLYQMILPSRISLGMQLLMLILVSVAVVMMLKKLISGEFSPKIAGAADLGVGDMPGAVASKAGSLMGSAGRMGAGAAKSTGRVAAGAAAKGAGYAARGADKKWNEGRLQKGGWIAQNNSKRQQRKSAHQARAVQEEQYSGKGKESKSGTGGDASTAEKTPRRTGRVSQGNTTPPPAATPTPAPVPQQAAPQPQPAPQPAQPRPPRAQPPQQPVVQQPTQPNPPQLPPQRPPGDGNRMPR
ncbi:hypothetical protein ABZ957_11400 [Streptomyces sp. NPDC046316]|uniref:hypothetical protein n=1 Tax=Streptomyces sp. NPDC046316 TaxID=3154494 RepID=UPI0033FE056B